jgi:hydroxylamine reductase (hybrid-cluster protein)
VARCDYCGRQYDEQAYQVVLQVTGNGPDTATNRSFDTVECAIRASAAAAAGGAAVTSREAAEETTLARLEQASAELFMARAQLVEERRRREDLERKAEALLGERDRLARTLAGNGGALAPGSIA